MPSLGRGPDTCDDEVYRAFHFGGNRHPTRGFEATEVIGMAGYVALPDVYEWLIPEDRLSPAGAVARFDDVVGAVPPGARVLDCACGTGQLAVGLAGLGLDVVATDASEGMVRRTRELAEAEGVSLRTVAARWDELPDRLDAGTFELVFCVGNSLGHAEGREGRLASLAAMSKMLRPGGRLVLTSRTWERERAAGSRLETRDRLIRRGGRDAVVTYYWDIQPLWEQEHHLEIAVAVLQPDGSVRASSERLSIWPYSHDELVGQLNSVGLAVEKTTFDPDADGYVVVARRASPA